MFGCCALQMLVKICFFNVFVQKAEKVRKSKYLDQHLECPAPKEWLKYSAIDVSAVYGLLTPIKNKKVIHVQTFIFNTAI